MLALAAAHLLLLLVTAGRYGYHRDELYFLEAGRHLDWGFVDQPPFTPVVARLTDEVFGASLVGLRLLPALTTAAVVFLAALLARELGGGRMSQALAAGAAAGAGFVLGVGHLLSTATFDLLAWMTLLWLATRMLRTDQPLWWLPFGGVAGAALWNKHLVALLALSLLVGLAADRRWALVRSPWLLAGGAAAVALALPNLLWQAANDFPQIEMARAITERIGTENRIMLLPGQIVLLGPLLLPFLVRGVRVLTAPAHRMYRPLVWTWIAGLLATLLTAGRPYYPLALTITVAVAGIVGVEQHVGRPRTTRSAARLVALNALIAVPIALPVLPVRVLAATPIPAVNDALAETIGWDELVETVAGVVEGLPPTERERVVLFTASYGEAGAIDRLGPTLGLPPAHSAHNAYWHFRQPSGTNTVLVSVRVPPERLAPYFDGCDEVARVDNEHGVDNEVRGTPVLVCRGQRRPWDEIWPELRFLS